MIAGATDIDSDTAMVLAFLTDNPGSGASKVARALGWGVLRVERVMSRARKGLKHPLKLVRRFATNRAN